MALHKKLIICSKKTLFVLYIYVFVSLSLLMIYLFYIQVRRNIYANQIQDRELATLLSMTQRSGLFKEDDQGPGKLMESVSFDIPDLPSIYLNINSFPYIINEPDKCKENSPFLIILISTVAGDIEKRDAIRITWGNEAIDTGGSIIRLFLFGVNDTGKHVAILNESQKYHDIIQKDFRETYRNLTIKTIMGMEWVSTYCPHANYVMKTDTDMFVNTEHLLNLLRPDLPPKHNYITGFLIKHDYPHRHKESKWYMPPSLYAEDIYPDFCSGTGYVFSADLAPKILNSSSKIKYLYLEDIFVGICLKREGVNITPPPTNTLFHNYKVPFSPCGYRNLITSHGITPSELVEYWEKVQDNKGNCSKFGNF
ncbi:beta-1,3-galactosyltransferase 2-like [Ascaphus truei]|uniref:beta-1,3-galactosyltransferase 2-like n=1 Tax=Ascaphus truei TaxID=8439 RepID=UPI003F5968E3